MPYSDPSFDNQIKTFIRVKKLKRYLDIGPGAGKYGRMIREVIRKPFIEAIEAERSYIGRFGLKKIYDKVYGAKVEKFFDNRSDYTTDLVTIGDCIEHLKKSDGIDLINFLVYRTKYILVVYPEKVIQYAWEGHVHEAHRSVWSEKDFQNFEYEYYKKKFMNLVIIKGYIGGKDTKIVK